MFSFGAADHVIVEIQEVAEDEGGDGHIQNWGWEEGFDEFADDGAEDEIGNGDEPHERVDEHGEDFAADDYLKGDDVGLAPLFDKFLWVAHVDEVGLHVAFDPAGALFVPVEKIAVGFF